MKRSQVTLFIIVGFVIILVFAFFYSFLHSYQGQRVDQQVIAGKSVEELTDSYERYVQSCTTYATRQGIYLAGQQGGPIYDTQVDGGMRLRGPDRGVSYGEYVLPRKNEDDGVVYNVSYGIKRSEIYEYEPGNPLYPFGGRRLVSNPDEIYNPSLVNVFGNRPQPGPLVPLCDSQGENREEGYALSCETYGTHQSIQAFLENFIKETTLECVQEEAFQGLNLSYDILRANTSLIFSNDEVRVEMDMPVNITSEGATISPDISTLEVRQNTRLKLIHELVDHLIKQDINDIFFDIVRDANYVDTCRSWRGTDSGCLKEGMEVSMVRNPCKEIDHIDCGADNPEEDGNFDNLLVIKDKDSYLFGDPYEFYIAIENRYPALDLIFDEEDLLGYEWDYIVDVGEEIKIDPKGYDPDSDHHGEYGFMQDYYDYLHIGPDAHYHPTDIGEAFMESDIYEDTNRKATYEPVEADKGNHTIRVRVCNQGGLCDYQDLSIFVGSLEPEGS